MTDQDTSRLVDHILADVNTLQAMEEAFIERVDTILADHLFAVACWWGQEFPNQDFELTVHANGMLICKPAFGLTGGSAAPPTPVQAVQELAEGRRLVDPMGELGEAVTCTYCAKSQVAECGNRRKRVAGEAE